MAEGRMLKKQISRSRRLGELKSDSARLLYTWILPHLDIKGRHEADPSVIKGEIVPRLESFNSKNIQAYLEDMHKVGLISLYRNDGDQFLQFRKFEEHQSLRPDKEACSRIPDPSCSGTTPVQLPDKVGPTPDEDKISKDKRSKKKPLAPSYNFETHEWENINGKTEFWSKAFPAIDIISELNKMGAWLDANPKNRKSNYPRFINSWLSKAQDKAPKKEDKIW